MWINSKHLALNQFKAMGLVVLCAFMFSLTSLAEEFPEKEGNSDVIYINEMSVDMALRTWAIANAKHSIQMINFSHGTDETGLHLAKALRSAMNNGVSVQYAYERSISTQDGGDWLGDIPRLLADSNLKAPAQVITSKIREKWAAKLSINDFTHEKAIIIDAGTPSEIIFVGGRVATNFSKQFLDSGYIIRPIDPSKPHLGQDIANYYAKNWDLLRTVFTTYDPKPITAREQKLIDAVPEEYPIENDPILKVQRLIAKIKGLISKPATESDTLEPFQFRPKKTQLVSNDMFKRVLSEGHSSVLARKHLEDNSIVRAVVKLIEKSKSIMIHTYSIILPDAIEEAIKRNVSDGGEVTFVTNGRDAHKLISPFGFAVDYSIRSILRIMGILKEAKGSVYSYFFYPSKEAPQANGYNPTYLHRKGGIFGDVTALGSENLTKSSSSKNNEILILLTDERLAQYGLNLFASEIPRYFKPVDSVMMLEELKATQHLSKIPLCRLFFEAMF